jgi:hypothetical protein
MLVTIKDDIIINVLHRNNCTLKMTILPGMACTALTLDCILVHVGSAIALAGSNQIGTDTLRNDPKGHHDRRIYPQRSA